MTNFCFKLSFSNFYYCLDSSDVLKKNSFLNVYFLALFFANSKCLKVADRKQTACIKIEVYNEIRKHIQNHYLWNITAYF